MLYFDFGLTINKENMFALILFGVGAIAISFYCSVMEAALLSIVPSYVAQLEDKNPVLFKKISLLKGNLDEPLAAILSLNTIAHTVGAAGVGAKVAEIYGQAYIGLASGIMTFLILTLSEILPKSVGTKYWKQLVPFLAWSLHIIMFVMKPLIWVCTLITRWFDNKSNDISNIKDEIKALARMGKASNIIDENKYRAIINIINLSEVKLKDIMTPRTVVHTVRPDMTIKEFDEFVKTSPFSRFPIVDETEQNFYGYIHKSSSDDAKDTDVVKQYGRPMRSFSPDAHLEIVLSAMLEDHNHMALVIDQFGNWLGIITLEDILETILGKEILDETDTVADMRLYAKMKWQKRKEQRGITLPAE